MNEDEKKDEYRTQTVIIKQGHKLYEYLDEILHNANNIYNATNFRIRQIFTALKSDKELRPLQKEALNEINGAILDINTQLEKKYKTLIEKQCQRIDEYRLLDENKYLKDEEIIKKYKLKKIKLNQYTCPNKDNPYLPYELLDNVYKHTNNIDYKSLPSHVNQLIMRKVFTNWTSFKNALDGYRVNPEKYSGKPRMPKYKSKGGMHEAIFSNQICLIKRNGSRNLLKFPKTKLTLNLGKYKGFTEGDLSEVRVQKYYNNIRIEVVMKVNDEKPSASEENKKITRFLGIDLGVNNLAACVSNVGEYALLINGKPLKSINQFYNKEQARLYSSLRIGQKPNEGKHASERLEKLHQKRFLKIKDYFHKASNKILLYALENKIEKVVIGKNDSWKKSVSMRKDVKQSFVYIPHSIFIKTLKYKLESKGIQVEIIEESYTSKASFLDNDTIPTYNCESSEKYTFSGKRVSRGLYITKEGVVLNADINAAANILRKYTKADIKIDRKVLSNVVKMKCFNGGNKNEQKQNRNKKNPYYLNMKHILAKAS